MTRTIAPALHAEQLASEVSAAELRIRPFIRETYVERSAVLEESTGARVFLKLENLQSTGSFKVRGAFSRILNLTSAVRERGIVTASTGNHGLAVAHVLKHLRSKGMVFVPTTVAPVKLAKLKNSGLQVEITGGDPSASERAAREHASRSGMTYVPPYNDLDVIAGQGTLGIELARQLDRIDDVFIAVGGGGLISGVAAYLKSLNPAVRIIGCQPFNSRVMLESVRAGRILQLQSEPTLSDGTAGGIDPDAVTFGLCQALVDDFVMVSEDEIRSCLQLIIDQHHVLIEGAAAVAVAGLLQYGRTLRGRSAAVVLCGANIDLATLTRSCQGKGPDL